MSDSPGSDVSTPLGWNKSTLGAVCSWLSGGTPSKVIPRYWLGPIPWVSPKDMKVFRISDAIDHVSDEAVTAGSRRVIEGTVLIVIRGMILAHSFPVAITMRPVAFNQDIKALICGPEVSGAFLAYWLVAKSDHILSIVSESTHGTKRFDLSDLRNLRFDTPPPPEQRKIARILTTVDNLIEKTEALIAKYQAIKQGMMHDLFTRGVDEHGHLRPPYAEAPELYKQSELGWIPKEWDCVTLGEVVPVAQYGISVSLDDSEGIPVLRMNNLGKGVIDATDIKRSRHPEARRLLLKDRDVLFNRTNSIDHVGRTSIWKSELAESSFASYLVRLVPNAARLMPEYLVYWMNRPEVQIAIRQFATPGVHQVNINPTNLRKSFIAVPSSLREQAGVTRIVLQHEKQIRMEQLHLSKLSKQKAGLMQDLLTGKVRVKADEAQEVAVHG